MIFDYVVILPFHYVAILVFRITSSACILWILEKNCYLCK